MPKPYPLEFRRDVVAVARVDVVTEASTDDDVLAAPSLSMARALSVYVPAVTDVHEYVHPPEALVS